MSGVIQEEKFIRNNKSFLKSKYDTEIAAALKCLGVEDLIRPQDPSDNPDFFVRLYEALSLNILDKQYRPRFFFWADVFLSSSKIPAYVMAAFIKKLSRMSLQARPECLMTILPFICNLLMRHPTLITLKHRVNQFLDDIGSSSDVVTLDYMKNQDPFNENELDFKECRALDSCIWEIAPLRFHWHPAVANSAKFLNDNKLPDIECDLTNILELTSQDMTEYFDESDEDDDRSDEDEVDEDEDEEDGEDDNENKNEDESSLEDEQ